MYYSNLTKPFNQTENMSLTVSLYKRVKEASKFDIDKESVGFFYRDGTILKLENVHEQPHKNWAISDKDMYFCYLSKSGDDKPIGIFHTHISDLDPDYLTTQDLIAAYPYKLRSFVYNTKTDGCDYFDPDFIHPYPLIYSLQHPKTLDFYTNWVYRWFRSDCYTVIRAFYAGYLDIVLDDFNRSLNRSEFVQSGWNRIEENIEKQGFKKLPIDARIQDFDIITFAIISPNVHHLAVVINAKEKLILHSNNSGELKASKIERYTDELDSFKRGIYRHGKFLISA